MLKPIMVVSISSLFLTGCPFFSGSSSSGTPSTNTPSTPIDQLPKALQCIVGKKIKIKGTYFIPVLGTPIDINREGSLDAAKFKVAKEGQDGLAEQTADTVKVETWEGDYVSIAPNGENYYGFQDETVEDCFEVTYQKGPFEGPGNKQCIMKMTATICEDTCTIKKPHWRLTCDVNADGSGGDTRADGSWEIDEPNDE